MLAVLLFSLAAQAKPAKVSAVAAPPPAPPAPAVVAPPPDPLATMPTVGADVPFSVPVPAAAKLENGVDVWVVPSPGLPLVTVVLTVPGGSALDPKGHEGAAALTDRLLKQGAGGRNAEQFAAEVERLGIQLDVETGRAMSMITMSVRKDSLGPALDLMADMVLRPAMTAADFKREKALAISELAQAQDEPVSVATDVAWSAWFGFDHPYGHPAEGTVTGMKHVTRGDVASYLAAAWNVRGAAFTVAGDVTAEEMTSLLAKRFVVSKGKATWATAAGPALPAAPAPAHTARRVLLVDKPGSAQTMFYLVFPGLPIGDAAVAPLRTGTLAFGGTFTSRLNALLREKEGFTYGIHARLSSLPQAGILSIQSRIRTDATGPAMKDILQQLSGIRQGITAEELGKARGAYRQDQVEAMETREGVAEAFANLHAAGQSPDALRTDLQHMDAVTQDSASAAMAAWDDGKAVFVLVGDRKAIEGPLKEAGITEIEVVKPI